MPKSGGLELVGDPAFKGLVLVLPDPASQRFHRVAVTTHPTRRDELTPVQTARPGAPNAPHESGFALCVEIANERAAEIGLVPVVAPRISVGFDRQKVTARPQTGPVK